MKRLSLPTILFVAGILLPTQTTSACRFTVRDVGFADLGVGAHYVFLFVDKNAPADFQAGLEGVLSTVLADTNMYAEIVNVDDSADHPAVEFTKTHDIKSFPAAILFAPDERTRPIVTDSGYEQFGEKLSTAVSAILHSPMQKEILQGSAATYGVVLLIEGKDPKENTAAADAAAAAIKTVEMNMDFLPKPIEKPPIVVTLSRKDFQTEENLLWFLNLDADKIDHTHAAVFYGRSRLLGPVLTGENLTEDILTNILAIVGADCECGLDRKWMQGPMLTAKISGKMQTDLVESLGFDPDNPMIKMEMSMILRRGPMSSGGFGGVNPFGAAPFGYQEIDVDFNTAGIEPNSTGEIAGDAPEDTTPEKIEESGNTDRSASDAIAPAVGDNPQRNDFTAGPATRIDASMMLMVLLGFGVTIAVILTGIIILLRARRYV
jgi:hypothetical protein